MAGQISVRKATREDRKAVFEWQKDQTLNSVYASRRSWTYRNHCRWFDSFLKDSDRLLLIGILETLRIGSVRFTRQSEGTFDVHLFVKPAYCGKGYSVLLFNQALAFLKQNQKLQKVFARVNYTNPATRRIFQAAGFETVFDEGSTLHFEWSL